MSSMSMRANCRVTLMAAWVAVATASIAACGDSEEEQTADTGESADTSDAGPSDDVGGSDGDASADAGTDADAAPLVWDDVVPGETADDYWRLPIPDAEARGAVCNDGSPFVVYVRPGKNGLEDHWILFLKGGGGCGSVEACDARWELSRNLMRAPGEAWRPGSNGIFNPDPADNPDWAEWTHAFLYYCSSDVWSGDREASDATGGWHFRGHRIVETALSDLQSPPEGLPSLADATDVMLMGSSAGSVGVQHNLDFVAETLPWADVVGVIDSAWSQGIPYDIDSPPERDGSGQAEYLELLNAQLDTSCLAAEAEPTTCLRATTMAINHVTTPYFVFMDQFDGVVLSRGGVTSLCVPEECQANADCGDDGVCVEGICATSSCETSDDCDGTCHEQGVCYAESCRGNADCPAGRACMQGFCVDAGANTLCDDHADCGDDGTCVGGLCFVAQTCTTNAECGAGESCNQQTYRCIPDIACLGADDCGSDELCLPRQQTPTVQEFARGIREIMAPLDGAFGTRGGFHTMLQSDNFLTRQVNGHTYAEVLGNWYFERSGPTHVVAWEE